MAPIKYLLIGAGLLLSAWAEAISFSEWPSSLTAGQPVTLKWIGGSNAPTTITLRKGASTDLQDVAVLTSDATNGVFTWTPAADLQNANDYAFQISQGDQINYTGLIPLTGGSDTPNTNIQNKNQMSATAASNAASESAASMTDAASSTGSESGVTATASEAMTASPTVSDSAMTGSAEASGATSSASGMGSSKTISDSSSPSDTGMSATPTETVKASKMNPPFVGSTRPTATTSASSVQTGAARRVVAPFALLAGSAGLFLALGA